MVSYKPTSANDSQIGMREEDENMKMTHEDVMVVMKNTQKGPQHQSNRD